MGLTAGQLTNLKNADQRFTAHVALFPVYIPTVAMSVLGDGALNLAPVPIPRVTPRHVVIDHSETVVLDATASYSRGGAQPTIYAWANTGGNGTLVDNVDGTADYTAPASGTTDNLITLTVSNGHGNKATKIYVQYPKGAYDEIVAEIASINASVGQHGWKMTLRARGETSEFAIGKSVLLHVEDTWSGTTATFGGDAKYSEGQFFGYISEMEYFEDGAGEYWLGVEVSSPWWILENTSMGETYWGRVTAPGRRWIDDFAPVDAIWHMVNDITDFTSRHDCELWFDNNSIDDFIIDESDMATIIADVMGRTLAVAFCDRYGALKCVPDPDVRASEHWGTPTPMFDAAGAGALNDELVSDYNVKFQLSQRTRKLTLEAVDNSKLGIWASNDAFTGFGDKKTIRGLIADSPLTLAHWAGAKRAQMNRLWQVRVDTYLNHTVDLLAFVDVNFTAVSQASPAVTASGLTWVESITYRPNIFDGGWFGTWTLNKQTIGDVNGVTAIGGSGIYQPITVPTVPSTNPGHDGDTGGWTANSGGRTLIGTFTVWGTAEPGITAAFPLVIGTRYEMEADGIIRFSIGDEPAWSADPRHVYKDVSSWAAPMLLSNQPIGGAAWRSGVAYGLGFIADVTAVAGVYNDGPGLFFNNDGTFVVTVYSIP